MTDFATAAAALPRVAPLDPTKHVNYTLGMVLGVDDFDQEFAFLSGRDRWLARDLSGYGTLWGLQIGIELEESGPRVNVGPGAALTPCGRLVCVTPAQCAHLNDWLAAHEEEVRGRLASPPDTTLRLYLVACYRECATDDVPIPGEPCRTEETLSAPSRLKDDFRLELRLAPPRQAEEDAIRDFVEWLRQVPVVAGPGTAIEDLLDEIRLAAASAIEAFGSPPCSPPASPPSAPFDFVLGLPPPELTIPAAEVTEYLRAAFALWVTELRPALQRALPGCDCGCADGGTCGCGCHVSTASADEPCDDDVVLLAALDLPLVSTPEGDLLVADSGWEVDETQRPYVLHTRFLQEWLLAGGLPFFDGSPPASPPFLPGEGITSVVVSELPPGSAPTASLLNGVLTLGIPAGSPGPGITSVIVNGLPPGASPTASLANGVLTLGIPSGAAGPAGAGIASVAVSGLPPGAPPSASLANGVLTLRIPAGATGLPGAPGHQFVVAAGRFGPQGGTTSDPLQFTFGNLTARPIPGANGLFFMIFDRFEAEGRYVIKGTAVASIVDRPCPFEVVEVDDELRRLLEVMNDPPDVNTGFFVRLTTDDFESRPRGFMVEVSDYRKAEG
jgi:hypothetical protein